METSKKWRCVMALHGHRKTGLGLPRRKKKTELDKPFPKSSSQGGFFKASLSSGDDAIKRRAKKTVRR